MSLLTPPPTGARPPPSELPVVVRFLNAHLEHGALQPNSYDKLYRVIQAIGEISLLLFPYSDNLDTVSSRRIETLADSIVDTLHAIGEHVDGKLWRAKRAMDELPNLAVRAEEKRQRNLRAWHQRLQTLHEPSNNDLIMYRRFLAYFDSEVHTLFLQLHRVNPRHNSWHQRHRLNHIRECFVFLCANVEEANKLVTELDAEFAFGSWSMKEKEAEKPLSPINETKDEQKAIAQNQKTTDVLISLDDFFDESTSPTYSIAAGISESRPEKPRVFTGSFSDLQESVQGLRLHHVNLSTDSDFESGGDVQVKDFALREPLRTPCLLPSPATLLERREALSVREATWEHRLIGGQVVQSRRPHDRGRALTVDERSGGLEAWLSAPPTPDKVVDRAGSMNMRVLQRQHTL